MLGARPKKMMNMYIYDILRRNTDAEHPMTQREIQKRLESDYDMTVDRKAVKANLEDLINDGSYNIEYATKIRLTPNRLTGEIEKNEVLTGFYYDNIFTDSELRLLMDSVLFSRSIPTNNKKEMLGKLKDLSNKYFKFSTANIQSYESVDREMNRELFYTIEVLDEAISKGLQVKFLYNEYGTDKKLHHRKNEDGEAREYIINPYTMVANGGKYYLICNYDKYDNLSHYRIDRISNIEILETPRKPKISLRHPLAGTALSAAIGIKPTRKPPVTEASTESPPRKPAKTGSPTAPTARYTTTATAAYGSGRMKPQSATAKVCSVIGTPEGIGMEISVHAAISAAKSAVNVNFSNDFFLFILSPRSR